MTEYNQQHCEKHNFNYAHYLRECPICAGERVPTESEMHEIIINEICKYVFYKPIEKKE